MSKRAVFQLAATLAVICAALPAIADDADAPRYTSSGALMLPSNYREWVFLSSGLAMTYGPVGAVSPDGNPRFDNVFVSRAAYQSFLKSGRWPDKTMFILEIRSSESKGSINNAGHYQSGVVGMESEVKEDGKWTFYSFERNATEGKPFARNASCYSCHAENGAVDNTFVQFYPTLLPIAKKAGTFRSTPESRH